MLLHSLHLCVFLFGVVMLQVAIGKAPDVRGLLNVDAEEDRRKHQLDLLSKNSLFLSISTAVFKQNYSPSKCHCIR